MTIALALMAAGLVAAFTTATVGVGGGLLVMPLLALFFAPRVVVAASAPMFWVNSLVTFFLYRKRFASRRVWLTIPGVVAGIFVGTMFVKYATPTTLRWIIGAVAIAFALMTITLRPKPGKAAWSLPVWSGVPISAFAGVVSALSNIGGTMISIFLLGEDVSPEVFVGGIAFLYVIMTSVKMVVFGASGVLTGQDLLWSLPSIGSILVGALLGRRLNQKISSGNFRWIVISVVGVSSVMLFISR